MKIFLKQKKDGFLIKVRAKPGSSKDEISGVYEDSLAVKIKASAVDGKANRYLVKFLAGKLDLPPSWIEIKSGERSRTKTLLIKGISAAKIKEAINSWL